MTHAKPPTATTDETSRRARMLAALDAVAVMISADGAALRVDAVDETRASVEVSLELEDVDCADCVLPPDRLRATLAAAVEREIGEAVRVVVHDPRQPDGPAPASRDVVGGSYVVLDPSGVAPDDGSLDAGPDAGPLTGKVVAIRHDVLWPAFDWTVEEWTAMFEDAGATVVTFARAQGEKDDVLTASDAAWDAILAGADVAVSGLGNCGSCTSWSVRDALRAATKGLATTVVATAHFETLARLVAAEGGRPGLRVTVLPYPYSTLDEETVRDHARREFDQLVDVLGAAVPARR